MTVRAEASKESTGLVAVEPFEDDHDGRLKRWARHQLDSGADTVEVFRIEGDETIYLGAFRLYVSRWPKWNVPPGCAGRLRTQLEFEAQPPEHEQRIEAARDEAAKRNAAQFGTDPSWYGR